MTQAGATPRVPCAGAVVHDAQGRILLIRRGTPPAQGRWSVPGGRCLPGESTAAACVRECAEETGLTVEVLRLAGTVERAAPGGGVYVIDDYVCRLADEQPGGAVPRAGDDADDARWASLAQFDALPLVPGLRDALGSWGLLPSP